MYQITKELMDRVTRVGTGHACSIGSTRQNAKRSAELSPTQSNAEIWAALIFGAIQSKAVSILVSRHNNFHGSPAGPKVGD